MNKLATLQPRSQLGPRRVYQNQPQARTSTIPAQKATIQNSNQPDKSVQELHDNIERDVPSTFADLQYRSEYTHLLSDQLPNPCYKGNFVNYHFLPIPQEIADQENDVTAQGILPEIWAAYYCFKRTIMFWFFEPSQTQKNDLNYYFNPSQRQPFPSRIQSYKLLQLDSQIQLLAISKDCNAFFQLKNDYLLCVATQFSISLYRLKYDRQEIEDIQYLNMNINTNGEEIHKMVILPDSLIMGGSGGYLRRVWWDDRDIRHSQVGLVEQISKQFKKIISFTRRALLVKQIEVDTSRSLVYSLVVSADVPLALSTIQVYQLGNSTQPFRHIFDINTSDQQIRNVFDYQSNSLTFNYIQTIKSNDIDGALLVITNNNYKMILSFNDHMNQQQISNQTELQQTYLGTYRITSYGKINQSALNTSFGVIADEERFQQFNPLETKQIVSESQATVYADEQLLAVQKGNYLYLSYPDTGFASFTQFLRSVISQHEVIPAIEHSIYKNNSRTAQESLELYISDPSVDSTEIQILDLQKTQVQQEHDFRKFAENKTASTNQLGFYQSPKILMIRSANGINFILQLRPIDILYQFIKLAPLTTLKNQMRSELESFIKAYGIFETATFVLQILCQPEQDFFISVDFETDLLVRVEENNQEGMDDTPIWVVGRLYCLKGHFIYSKAKQFYLSLLEREILPQSCQQLFYGDNSQQINQPPKKQASSTKIMGFITLLRRILEPIYYQRLFNEKVYNLEENGLVEEVSLATLKQILQQVIQVKQFFESTHLIDRQKEEKTRDNSKNDPNSYNLKGFSLSKFNQCDQNETFEIIQKISTKDAVLKYEEVLKYYNLQTYMGKVYRFAIQIIQLFNLIIYLIEEGDIRSKLKRLSDKDREIFFNLSIYNIFSKNPNFLIVVKLLLSHILRDYQGRSKEFNGSFSEYFDESDFKVNVAQLKLETILIDLLKQGQIQSPNSGIKNKIKQLLKFDQPPLIHSLTTIISRPTIEMYYKRALTFQIQFVEITDIMNDLGKTVNHKHIARAFLNLLLPVGMLDVYVRTLLVRARSLDQQYKKSLKTNISGYQGSGKSIASTFYISTETEFYTSISAAQSEFLDCENQIVTDFQYLCELLINHDPSIIHVSPDIVQDMLLSMIQVYQEFELPTVHALVIRYLYKAGLSEYIIKMNSPYVSEECIDDLPLKQYKLLFSCHSHRGDQLRSIEYCLKIARYSFTDQSESSFQQILSELPLTKRLEYLGLATDLLAIISSDGISSENQRNLIIEYSQRVKESTLTLRLQNIVFECLLQGYQSQDYNVIHNLEQIVRFQYDFEKIASFFFTNGVYFGQILAIDYAKTLLIDIGRIQILPISSIYQYFIETQFNETGLWPQEHLQNQICFLYNNLIDKEQYFQLEQIIRYCEMINYQREMDWLSDFLSDTLKLPMIYILQSYFIVLYGRATAQEEEDHQEYRIHLVKVILKYLQKTFRNIKTENIVKSTIVSKEMKDIQNNSVYIAEFLQNEMFQNIDKSVHLQDLYILLKAVQKEFDEIQYVE